MSETRPAAPRRAGAAKVFAAGTVGNFVEWFDFALYGFSAPIIAKVFFPGEDPTIGLLSAFAVYAVAFLARPIGAAFFGSLGDRIGRRNTLSMVILGMGLATFIVGLLPSHQAIGLAAPVLLVVARLLQGFCAGGEATGASTFVAEYAPRDRRGLWVSFIASFSQIGSAAAALVIMLFSLTSADSFTAWAWRIPFLLGGCIAVVGLYVRLRLAETPAFEQIAEEQDTTNKPLREVIRTHPKEILLVFCLLAYVGVGAQSAVGYLPTYVSKALGLSTTLTLMVSVIILIIAWAVATLTGLLSDLVGRRPVAIVAGASAVLLSIPGYLIVGLGGGIGTAMLSELLIIIPFGMVSGVAIPSMVELFKPRVRYAGTAIAYNAAQMALGGTAPFVNTLLLSATGTRLSVGIYLTAIAALAFIAILVGLPETRGMDILHSGRAGKRRISASLELRQSP